MKKSPSGLFLYVAQAMAVYHRGIKLPFVAMSQELVGRSLERDER